MTRRHERIATLRHKFVDESHVMAVDQILERIKFSIDDSSIPAERLPNERDAAELVPLPVYESRPHKLI